MADFGWSYPAGCSGTPADEPSGPCDVCGGDVDSDSCICPECPECGDTGNPKCYEEHGMIRTEEQSAMFRQNEFDRHDEAEEPDHLEQLRAEDAMFDVDDADTSA